jgi:hypothetical protein
MTQDPRVFHPKKMVRVPHPVYSSDLSPCDFRFFGYAKERMKNQGITGDDDLENKSTEVGGSVSEDVLQSVFQEWMERLEWVREHEGEYPIHPHELNKNCISCSRDKEKGP